MFFGKSKEIDRQMSGPSAQGEETPVIRVKARSREDIFSSYDYEGNLTPGSELCDYLLSNARRYPVKESIEIAIHTDEEALEREEVECALKEHYAREYRETKAELKRNAAFSLIMLVLGLISLALLLVFHSVYDNYYVTAVIEIMAWVFVWEAVDAFFLERGSLKRRCLRLQQLYTARLTIENGKKD